MPLQPNLPAPSPYTEIEAAFIDEEPPGLWPENQDSNFGTHRKIFCDELMNVAGQLDLLLNEKFLATSTTFLGFHEEELGLTVAPAGKTVGQRRATALARRKRGPFTHALLASVIEPFIIATFGAVPTFGTSGIVLGSGVPLYSGASGDPKNYYRIWYDYRNFALAVWIVNTVIPDLAALTREIQRITPAGITPTIDNTQANILRYSNQILNLQPIGYWRMGTVNDVSGNGYGLTANGGVVAGSVAAGGLLADVTVSGNEGATTFDGVDDYFANTGAIPLIKSPRTAFGAWVKLNVLPTSGNTMVVASTGSRYIGVENNATFGLRFVFTVMVDGVQKYLRVIPSVPIAINTTYYLVGVYDGLYLRLFVNGVEIGNLAVTGSASFDSGGALSFNIGRYVAGSAYWNGVIDEVAVYDRALTADEVLRNYKTGTNVL